MNDELHVLVKQLETMHRVSGFVVQRIIENGAHSEFQQTVFDLLMAGF